MGPRITEKLPLKKIENIVLFGAFYFKNKNSWHFQFSISQIFQQSFIVSENLTCNSQLLLTLLAVEVAISFISLLLRSSWQQTDENSRKLDNTFFWKPTPRQVFVESFKFFGPPTTKWRSFKFFAKLIGNHILMANFSKLRKYQTFALIELHNLSSG